MFPIDLTITPNWHIAVVHFPIALLAVGLFAEVAGAILGAAGLRQGGRWMLALGAFAGLPVAMSGYYGLWDVVSHSSPRAGMQWRDVTASSTFSPAQWDALIWHAKLQSVASVVALFTVAIYLAAGDLGRRLFYLLGLFLLTAAVLTTLLGAHLGGAAVYTHGTGVGRAPATLPAEMGDKIATVVPPMEVHALLAGATVSLGVLALATAHRNVSLRREPKRTPILIGNRRPPAPEPLLPAAGLLFLSSLLALTAAAAGIWFLQRSVETWSPRELWSTVFPVPVRDLTRPENREILRRPVHVAFGAALVLVPLLLAVWHKWRPEGRFILALLTLTYLAAAAGQLPLGALLLYDGPAGPIAAISTGPDEVPSTLPGK
jgi:uncharacterized membrane protein